MLGCCSQFPAFESLEECFIASVEIGDEDFGDDGDIDDKSFVSENVEDGLIVDLLDWNDVVYDDIVDLDRLGISLGAAIAAAAARAGEAR